MLKLAKVGPNDVVYDLGSGDGRIPIAAVQKFNAKSAVGIDIDPQRIKEANENHAKSGVGARVRFLNQDCSRRRSARRRSSRSICCSR